MVVKSCVPRCLPREKHCLILSTGCYRVNLNASIGVSEKMKFREKTLLEIADMICGNTPVYFKYRSSSKLDDFFADCDTDFRHDGTTRNRWVVEVLRIIVTETTTTASIVSNVFARVISILMDKGDATEDDVNRNEALKKLNLSLSREGYAAFYAEDNLCYLKHVSTSTVINSNVSPHRPLTASEETKKKLLSTYLETISEDDLIEKVLMPLFKRLGFLRVSVAGHKDKSLEYGKDVWMKFQLPTLHMLYFGLQAKKDKLDAAGGSKPSTHNIAEILNQLLMMLGHEIFDPEIGKKVLVDHAFIVAGGEITKAARNWLGGKLDNTKRSQVMFIDREDILNLYIVNSLDLPAEALPKPQASNIVDDSLPF